MRIQPPFLTVKNRKVLLVVPSFRSEKIRQVIAGGEEILTYPLVN